jgi:glycosyltransferase involved in cell wall biosynthesis
VVELASRRAGAKACKTFACVPFGPSVRRNASVAGAEGLLNECQLDDLVDVRGRGEPWQQRKPTAPGPRRKARLALRTVGSLRSRTGFRPEGVVSVESDLRIAFLGTYPPRRCGIATFTRDLASGMKVACERMSPMAVAVTDAGGQYEYPEEVEYEIRQGTKGDYARAAELVNYKDVRWVSLQHEYGIFGGDDGAYILDFLRDLHVPAVVTLHTVLQNPSASQRMIVQRLAKVATLVVMSRVAADLLARCYDLDSARIHVIPHGIPDMVPRDQQKLKARFGVIGHRMLLTFGLLGPGKGIETVIRALPAAIDACPDLVYFVVGATHPAVLRTQGEAYRTTLEREAENLGVRDHVVFRDQYVTTEELCAYLQATDVFVSPYLNAAQVTSGALSYAMGAGAAVVSTPYWHAQELLADGRGCLFPFADSAALATSIVSLMNAPAQLAELRSRGYDYTRDFTWPRVGAQYLDLGATLAGTVRRRPQRREPPRASSLPELRLDHLLRMTDDTGIIQHATFSVPARESGYCVDDNGRALMVALHADRLSASRDTKRLVSTYLGFLLAAQTSEGSFRNLMSYDRSFSSEAPSQDCTGRALWALGLASHLASDEGQRMLARQMFERGLACAQDFGPRGSALTVLGIASFLTGHPEVTPAAEVLATLAARLCGRYRAQATDDWHWFEPTLTYDNAMLPLALFRAYRLTSDPASLEVAQASLAFLEGICFRADRLVLVGNDGWHSRGGAIALGDEQPIDAAAFVLAFRAAYLATGNHHYLRRMRQSFAWFLGANRLGISIYDSATAGCRDGLGATSLNLNQGAESTICFLLSLIEMLELADEGLEFAESPSANA